MVRKLLLACTVAGLLSLEIRAWAQDVEKPKQPETAAPEARRGGGIYGDFNQAMPDEALPFVAKQAGIELVPSNPSVWQSANPITLKVENGYFWPTFLEMCSQAKMRFTIDVAGGGKSRLRMYEAAQMPEQFGGMPQSVHDGFIVMAQSATRTYSVSYAKVAVPGRTGMQVQLQICADPTTPIASWNAPVVTEATDENGAPLVPKDDRQTTAVFGGAVNGMVQRCTLQLSDYASIGKKLVLLKGTITGNSVVQTQAVDIDLPLQPEGKAIKSSDSDITIVSFVPRKGAAGAYSLTIRFANRAADGGARVVAPRRAPPGQLAMVNSIVVSDAKDNPLAATGANFSPDPQGGSLCTMGFSSRGTGEPTKITWKLPMATKQIQIPFEFKDLAIP